MPENSVSRYLEEGILQADAFLRQHCGAVRFPDAEARAVKDRSFVAGWQISVQTSAATRRINIHVDGQFPFSLPRFLLVDRPPFLTWPHIEEDGVLCLDRIEVGKFRQPADVIGVLFHSACRLISECETGANENEFRTEFLSYWNHRLSTTTQKLMSLLRPRGPSRLVQIWRGKIEPVVGETEAEVLAWLRNRFGDKPQFDATDHACLLWTERPLLPADYPETGADLYRMALGLPGGKLLVERFAQIGKAPYYFLIGAESENGPCLAAVRTEKPVSKDIRGRTRDTTTNGFRRGEVPPSELTTRLFSSAARASRMRSERVDAEWIHGRGKDPRQKELAEKTVIIFGCGSVGAPVGQYLAMAGVGQILPVDQETLSWGNVGRHPLGAQHVGSNKATALAALWRKDYPHARFEDFPVTSQQFIAEHSNLLGSADLIICATADWTSERDLNIRQGAGEIAAPILYTWTEPHACAGHAVVIFSSGACFQCGLSIYGDSKLKVTDWPSTTEQAEPACGAVFQPYGPVELMGTIAVAATLALDALLGKATSATHRIWAGPQSLLSDAGGTWSKEWIKGDPGRNKGGFQEESVWERDPCCDICASSEPCARSASESESPRSVSSSTQPS